MHLHNDENDVDKICAILGSVCLLYTVKFLKRSHLVVCCVFFIGFIVNI